MPPKQKKTIDPAGTPVPPSSPEDDLPFVERSNSSSKSADSVTKSGTRKKSKRQKTMTQKAAALAAAKAKNDAPGPSNALDTNAGASSSAGPSTTVAPQVTDEIFYAALRSAGAKTVTPEAVAACAAAFANTASSEQMSLIATATRTQQAKKSKLSPEDIAAAQQAIMISIHAELNKRKNQATSTPTRPAASASSATTSFAGTLDAEIAALFKSMESVIKSATGLSSSSKKRNETEYRNCIAEVSNRFKAADALIGTAFTKAAKAKLAIDDYRIKRAQASRRVQTLLAELSHKASMAAIDRLGENSLAPPVPEVDLADEDNDQGSFRLNLPPRRTQPTATGLTELERMIDNASRQPPPRGRNPTLDRGFARLERNRGSSVPDLNDQHSGFSRRTVILDLPYDDLPPPWNAPPAEDDLQPVNFSKLMQSNALQKFDGTHINYEYFRTDFITCVHSQNTRVVYKMRALIWCLKDKLDVQDMLHTMGTAPADGYVQVILHLENHFGGASRIVQVKLHALRALPPVNETNVTDVSRLVRRMRAYKSTLSAHGLAEQFNVNAVLHDVLSLLSRQAKQQYLLWAATSQLQPMVTNNLFKWLQNLETSLAHIYELDAYGPLAISAARSRPTPHMESEPFRERAATDPGHIDHNTFLARTDKKCVCCNGTWHPFVICPKYMAFSPQERIAFIKEQQRCIRCLANHTTSKCPKKRICKTCSKEHHWSLHIEDAKEARVHFGQLDSEDNLNDSQSSDVDNEVFEAISMHASLPPHPVRREATKLPKKMSLRTLTIQVKCPSTGRTFNANAMLDDGSEVSVLSTDLAAKLKLCTSVDENRTLRMNGIGGTSTDHPALTAQVTIKSLTNAHECPLAVTVIPQPAGNLRAFDWTKLQSKIPILKDLSLMSPVNRVVDIIIGNDHKDLMRSIVEKYSDQHDARLSKLGWTIVGELPTDGSVDVDNCFLTHSLQMTHVRQSVQARMMAVGGAIKDAGGCQGSTVQLQEDRDLTRLLHQTWALDKAPEANQEQTPQNRILEQKLNNEVKKVDGRYVAPILWKPGEPSFVNNREACLQRLQSLLETKLKDPAKRKKYNDVIQSYRDRGLLVRRPPPEEGEERRYLPHFPIVKASNKDKVRPVMDAAAKFHGKSLNDAIFQGPNYMNDLVEVLVAFRKHSVGITCDVSDMFHQIRLCEKDCPFHMMLWIENNDPNQVVDLMWLCLVFGVTCCPCEAMFATRANADQFEHKMPETVQVIKNHIIVDDVTTSTSTIAQAKTRVDELLTIFSAANMEIKKWGCSHPEVIAHLPPEMHAKTLHMNDLGGENTESSLLTLGMRWETKSDVFTFHMELPERDSWTPRDVLSTFLQLFDPMGLISPYILTARKFFQELWVRYRLWKAVVPEHELADWHKWLACLGELDQVHIPRPLHARGQDDDAITTELHLFSDASEYGYGCAAYYKVIYASGQIQTALIRAKSRIAPLEFHSIPRLELVAAVLMIPMMESLKKSLAVEHSDTYLYTDSRIVLCWLFSMSRLFTTFVANRIAMLHEQSDLSQWSHVASDQNPADLASRGASPSTLAKSDLWLKGPQFLREPTPSHQTRVETVPEAEKELKRGQDPKLINIFHARVDTTKDGFDLPTFHPHPANYSSFAVLVGILRMALYWLQFRKPEGEREPLLTRAALHGMAEALLFRKCQQESYPVTLKSLRENKQVNLTHTLARMSPIIDEAGVLRTNARLASAKYLNEDAKRPVVIPPDHPLCQLVLHHLHADILFHSGGHKLLVAAFQRRFHAPGIITMARAHIKDCFTCEQVHAKPRAQKFGNLPDYRHTPSTGRLAPFHTTGIDAAGPFYVECHGQLEKYYFLLFTCAQYRLINIEVVCQMTASSMLMAFDRFLARNPRPATVISDNGGNFVKGDCELREAWLQLDKNKFISKHANIHWQFNPPKASHVGGFFERLIQSVKRAFYAVLPPARINAEEFATILIKIEGALNNRPLPQLISDDPEDPQCLTPNHFRIGMAAQDAAPVAESMDLKQRWTHCNAIADQCWGRLGDEIRPHYQPLNKWIRAKPNFRVGDLVLYLESKNRGKWPIARVAAIEQSDSDGLVRVVTVKYKGRFYRRSANSLLLLEAVGLERQ